MQLSPAFLSIGILAAAFVSVAHAQSYTFTQIAGTPPPIGSADGVGTLARFNNPNGIAVDSSGNVYVTDTDNNTVRRVSRSGIVTTLAGSPRASGSIDGTGPDARFNQPLGIAVDRNGTVWVADYGNHTIRRITPTGMVTTFAGEPGVHGSSNGTGTTAHFNRPVGIAVDSAGNVYVADRGNCTIRKITSAGLVSTIAGLAGSSGDADGTGSYARFTALAQIAVDGTGNVYAPDSSSHTIRKITPDGVVTTLAGTAGSTGSNDGSGSAARFSGPRGVGIDSTGNVFVADSMNNGIRKITPDGVVTLFAGDIPTPGNNDGTAALARFFFPTDVAVDSSGNVYAVDNANYSIRKITPAGVVTLLAGGGGNFGSNDGSGSSARFYFPNGIGIAADGSLIVGDTFNFIVRRVTPDGVVTTLAGVPGYQGFQDDTLTTSEFMSPTYVATDSRGEIWISDTASHSIRHISTTGNVRTWAGTAKPGIADGAWGVGALNGPRGIALDGDGNLFIADTDNNTIRKVTPDLVMSTFAGSVGITGNADGTGTAAQFHAPVGLAIGPDGTIYVGDTGNQTIRKITAQGVVTTFAGSAGVAGSADGLGTAASFGYPAGLTVDRQGNVFVADFSNSNIRKITPDGRVTTIGGLAGAYGSASGTGATARFDGPAGIVVDASGVLYIVDNYNAVIYRGALDTVPKITAPPQPTVTRPGSTVSLSVAATGGGLSYQWQCNGAAITGATNSTYTLANVQSGQAGSYSVTVSNSAGSTTSTAAPLTVSNLSKLGRISNLAIRSQAGTGAQTLIVGFSIGGNGSVGTKPLLVRAVGPTLGTYGVSGVMADPKLEIYSTSAGKITENDNWGGDSQVSAIGAAFGAFALSGPTSKDAALYNTAFVSGGYTAQVSGNGGTGVALAEIYDATPSDNFTAVTPRLTNVSARTQVGTGGDILIAGFVIGGETAKNILIRAVGPTLASYGVNGTLADPKLELYNSSSVKINENDNWGGAPDLTSAFASVGAFALPAVSKDAALLVTLTPGNYTVQVSGVGGTTGVALVEVYEVP